MNVWLQVYLDLKGSMRENPVPLEDLNLSWMPDLEWLDIGSNIISGWKQRLFSNHTNIKCLLLASNKV